MSECCRVREGRDAMRELGLRGAGFEPQFTGPDRAVFKEGLKERLIHQGPRLVCSIHGFAESIGGAGPLTRKSFGRPT